MKRVLTAITLIALSIAGANAQSKKTEQAVTFGIRAGVDLQNINGHDYLNNKLDNDPLLKFNVGVNAEIPIGTDWFIQPGILYTTKGAKSGDNKVNLGYIEVPVYALYKPDLGDGHLLLGVGPYIGFGVGGKVGNKAVTFTKSTSSLEFFANQGAYFKRVDAGGNLLIGYEFASNLSFQLNAQLGLANIAPELTSGDSKSSASVKNTGFGLSVGYRF
ncbi:porin family protein [Pinibacter aurantiacus]|uniref:PorT family protein n=1 Tax=Pinibacter aurantiacus TaxID=2851599 RepID=A0A9E2SG91_9BACT|nr:porin family protein [Pinibacter aurantiacus]MBV4359980.1 PorT family protein [Pinibacter aurantiacus]